MKNTLTIQAQEAGSPPYAASVSNNFGVASQEPGNIIMRVGNDEVMRFEPNGDIFVHGRLAENDQAVVQGFRDFLTNSSTDPLLLVALGQKLRKELDHPFSPMDGSDHCEWCETKDSRHCVCGCARCWGARGCADLHAAGYRIQTKVTT